MSDDLRDIEALALRVHDLAGWHSEFYLESSSLKHEELYSLLQSLPCVCVDHLGMGANGLPLLLNVLSEGNLTIKATGFGRVDFNRDGIVECLRSIVDCRPDKLVFGTDLPSTRAQVPFNPSDVDLVVEAIGVEASKRVMLDNALNLYRI